MVFGEKLVAAAPAEANEEPSKKVACISVAEAPAPIYQNVYNITGSVTFGSGFVFGADKENAKNAVENAPLKFVFPKKIVNGSI
jgi:hypothetical protein